MKMKKKVLLAFFVILLTATASIFAASSFKGKARLRFGFEETYKHVKRYGILDKSDFTGSFFLEESTKSAKGNGDKSAVKGAYAEVEAYAKFRSKFFAQPLNDIWISVSNLKYRVGFNKARFVFDEKNNFAIALFGHTPMHRFAHGWEYEVDTFTRIETEPFATTSTAMYKKSTSGAKYNRAQGGYFPNIGITYDKFSIGFGIDGGYGGDSYAIGEKATFDNPDYLLTLGVNDMTISDEMKFSVEAGVYNSSRMTYGIQRLGQQSHILYGGQFVYKTKDLSVEAGATGNYRFNKGGQAYTDVDERNAIEASLNISMKGDFALDFDAWFLDNQALWSDANEPDEVTYNNRGNLGFVYRDKDGGIFTGETGSDGASGDNNRHLHKALSMQLAMKPTKDIGVTIKAQDVLNQGIYSVLIPLKVSKQLTITPVYELTVDTKKTYQDGRWDHFGDDEKANMVNEGRVEVNYKHDLFSLFGYIRVGGESCNEGFYIVPYIDINSKKIIDGATLRFRWTDGVLGSINGRTSGKFWSNNDKGYLGKIFLEARIDFR